MTSLNKNAANSFSKLDETRPVNTPRSLLACDLEGVQPEELVTGCVRSKSPGTPRRKSLAGDPLQETKRKLEDEFIERERKHLIEVVRKRWTQLGSGAGSRLVTGGSFSKAAKPQLSSPRKPAADNKGGSASVADSLLQSSATFGLEKEIHAEVLAAVEADVSVAQHFLRLRSFIENAEKAQQALEEREIQVKARYDALQKQKEKEVIERSAKFAQQLEKVTKSKEEQLSEWKARHESRLEELQQRMANAGQQAQQLKLTKSSKAAAKDGEAERLAAEQAKKDRLAELEARLEAANEAARLRKEERKQEEQLHQFRMELKRRALEQTRERQKKAQKFLQAQIRERENEQAADEEVVTMQRQHENKVRTVIREVVSKQREEISKLMETAESSKIEPPLWLRKRIDLLESSRSGGTSPTKGAKAPQKPAGAPTTATSKRPGAHSASSDDAASRLPRVPKDKFTLSSPRVSERQVFGRWMYD